jgi:hypothetical protein
VAANHGTVKSVKDLRVAVEHNNWGALLEIVVRRFFSMAKTEYLREKETTLLVEVYTRRRTKIMSKKKQDRTREEIQFSSATGRKKFMAENAHERRDIVYENALLMCQQLLVYKDFYSTM